MKASSLYDRVHRGGLAVHPIRQHFIGREENVHAGAHRRALRRRSRGWSALRPWRRGAWSEALLQLLHLRRVFDQLRLPVNEDDATAVDNRHGRAGVAAQVLHLERSRLAAEQELRAVELV